MQDYNDNNQNKNRKPSGSSRPEGGQQRRPSQGQPRPNGQPRTAQHGRPQQNRPPQQRPVQGQQNRPPQQRQVQGQQNRPPQQRPVQGQQNRPPQQRQVQGQQNRPPQQRLVQGPQQRTRQGERRQQGQTRPAAPNEHMQRRTTPNRNANVNNAPHQSAKKKRKKIVLFIAEIFLLLILVGALWAVNKAQKIQLVKVDDTEVSIDQKVKDIIQQEGESKKGYRNIALFGVDSRDKQLDKSTRTDVIMVASINLDTKEVKLISVYRDTWLNMSTDSYNKANAAYAKGGPKQAISMLNMNLDLDITDFITVGFDGLIEVIDAVGGVEIDVKEAEVVHLNSYQISMVGRVVGENAAGEPEYYAEPYKEYTPVEHAGLQTLNGLQATAYCRIRYVGNDFERTVRQRTVLTKVAQKAMTMNPATLNKIAEAVVDQTATSLEMSEILSLLSGIASYKIGDQSGFPFEGNVQTGRVGKASVVIPVDLNQNVKRLHAFLFGNENYEPSDTVKRCSQKIASDTGVSYKGE